MDFKISPIFHIRYKYHVLFQKSGFDLCKPFVREAVGWRVRGDDEAIWLLWYRSAESFLNGAIRAESGSVTLKDEIMEIKMIA